MVLANPTDALMICFSIAQFSCGCPDARWSQLSFAVGTGHIIDFSPLSMIVTGAQT